MLGLSLGLPHFMLRPPSGGGGGAFSGERMIAATSGTFDTDGRYAISDDGGATWTKSAPTQSANMNCICYSPGLQRFLAGGANGVIMYTDDGGLTWVEQVADQAVWIIGCAWDIAHSLFVITYFNGVTTGVATSPTGLTGSWTARTSADEGENWDSLVYDGFRERMWCSVSGTHTVRHMYSDDGGATWTLGNTVTNGTSTRGACDQLTGKVRWTSGSNQCSYNDSGNDVTLVSFDNSAAAYDMTVNAAGTIWVGSATSLGSYWSANGINNWTADAINIGHGRRVTEWSPTFNRFVGLRLNEHGCYSATDGKSWTDVNGATGMDATDWKGMAVGVI